MFGHDVPQKHLIYHSSDQIDYGVNSAAPNNKPNVETLSGSLVSLFNYVRLNCLL